MIPYRRGRRFGAFGGLDMATATLGEWVNARDGARIIGDVDPRFVKRLGEKGLITTRALDGVRARFLRCDLERLAKSSVRPAPDPEPPAA